MVRCAHVAAEGEPCRLEGFPKADVKGHVRVVCMHVEPAVLARLVRDDKGVMVVEVGGLDGEEHACDLVDETLKGGEGTTLRERGRLVRAWLWKILWKRGRA